MIEVVKWRLQWIALAVLLLACNLVLVSLSLLWLRYLAAYVLVILLPGLLVGSLWFRGKPSSHLSLLERGLFMIGCGYATSIFSALLLSYTGSRFDHQLILFSFTALALALLGVLVFFKPNRGKQSNQTTDRLDRTGAKLPTLTRSNDTQAFVAQRLPAPTWQIAALASILAVAIILRLPNLGYSDFGYDEVRVLLTATELIQGREDALFIHDKGPSELLVTASLYALAGGTSEALARIAFTIANLSAVVTILVLGWRALGPIAGWVAALLMAVDGYLLGFSQLVQYQNLVALMALLAVLGVYLHVASHRSHGQLLLLSAFLLAAGVLSHYEAMLAAIPIGYFFVRSVVHAQKNTAWSVWMLAVSVFSLLTSLFYVPFVAHPRFARTLAEISGNRIGTELSYNNLNDFFTRTLVYSSTYYLAAMILGIFIAWVSLLHRQRRPRRTRLAIMLGAAGLLITLFNPGWIVIAGTDHTWLFFALVVAIALVKSANHPEQQATWLWFGITFMAAIFFVQKPRTHVYNFILPWTLLAGYAAQVAWRKLYASYPVRALPYAGVAAIVLLIGSFANYQYWLFTYSDTEILRTWTTNRPAGYWFPFERLSQNAILGFPFKNGWKVVGSLYAMGSLEGPLERNGERGVTQWYTRGGVDCSRDARYFVYTKWTEPLNKRLTEETPRPTSESGYHLRYVVQVNGETRLEIFDRAAEGPVQILDSADFEQFFDRTLSNPAIASAGPVLDPEIESHVNYRFGEHIRLLGFSRADATIQPGQQGEVTLFWTTDAPITESYKVFNQIINLENLHKAGQRDGIPGCERHSTDSWQPGQIIADRYHITILPDAPPGDYSHLIGLYDDQEERLPVFDQNGNHVGDSIVLDEVTVVPLPP